MVHRATCQGRGADDAAGSEAGTSIDEIDRDPRLQ
jgi:hypothetical protein